MNNTVQAIIDMDKAARQQVAEAREKALGISRQNNDAADNLIKKADEDIKKEAKRICDEIKRKSDAEIQRVKTDSDEKCRRLDEVMKTRSDKLSDDIIDRILRGE